MTTVEPGTALETTTAPVGKTLTPAKSLLERARLNDDQEAITLMFRQFLPKNEEVIAGHYLGSQGFLWAKLNSLACVTPRRVAVLFVTPLSEVTYQDGLLTAIRTASLYQPSRLRHMLARIMNVPLRILSVLTAGVLGVGIKRLARNTGMALNIDGGATIYLFSERKLLGRLNALYRIAITQAREEP
jgi:hypothetical protein